MRTVVFGLLISLIAALLGLLGWRQMDHRADTAETDRLLALQPVDPALFSYAMIADLPEPAQRYFRHAIAEGTPLFTVADIQMTGQFSLGPKSAPNPIAMQARQVLAAPHGFVWAMSGGSGLMQISGSDTSRWTRFWLNGIAPVARAGAGPDFARSAFGRMVAEAAFWTPAALLPGPGVTWEAVDDDTARVTVREGEQMQSVDLTVDPAGRLVQGVFDRWTDANPQKQFRLQPFGAYPSQYRSFAGFRVPTHVEAGNNFGTDGYFPFFIADVTDLRFVPRP